MQLFGDQKSTNPHYPITEPNPTNRMPLRYTNHETHINQDNGGVTYFPRYVYQALMTLARIRTVGIELIVGTGIDRARLWRIHSL